MTPRGKFPLNGLEKVDAAGFIFSLSLSLSLETHHGLGLEAEVEHNRKCTTPSTFKRVLHTRACVRASLCRWCLSAAIRALSVGLVWFCPQKRGGGETIGTEVYNKMAREAKVGGGGGGWKRDLEVGGREGRELYKRRGGGKRLKFGSDEWLVERERERKDEYTNEDEATLLSTYIVYRYRDAHKWAPPVANVFTTSTEELANNYCVF